MRNAVEGTRGSVVVWLCCAAFVVGLGVSVVGLSPAWRASSPRPAPQTVEPHIGTRLLLEAGTHQLRWNGEYHRDHPAGDELRIVATSSSGVTADQRLDDGYSECGTIGCTLGYLDVPTTDDYDVLVTPLVPDPSRGQLVIESIAAPRPTDAESSAPFLVAIGVALIVGSAGCLLVRYRSTPS
jgi:hypothetical protein